MYSDKENINILTALLVAHGIEHAVVCPGSRNAPIVHNLEVCPDMTCHAVTDERSAGFYALGLAQSTRRPVVVCVTSGTALLNVLPAVAEAKYQHVPLVVVSADRPRQWIDQLDGQTLPQHGALAPFVCHSVSLPEPSNDEERWLCNRMTNEALCLVRHPMSGPVHINVPISEPLFQFTTSQLSVERVFHVTRTEHTRPDCRSLSADLKEKRRTMIVLGCTNDHTVDARQLNHLRRSTVVIYEPLMADAAEVVHFDEVLARLGTDDDAYWPDLIIYVGGTVVSKRLRHFLRRSCAATWLLTTDARTLPDPTMHLARVVECRDTKEIGDMIEQLSEHFGQTADNDFLGRWNTALSQAEAHATTFEPRFSQMAVAKYFEEQIDDLEQALHVHYANSSAIRLACLFAQHHVWCNRGVNGIEGSLSTAAGFSLGTSERVVCITGDLSFFYDQNALSTASLRGNLRIVLLNNHRGGIFDLLPGLNESPAAKTSISGGHTMNARGICEACDVGYLSATNMEEMQLGIVTLLTREANRPMVLEVTTNADDDAKEMKRYYEQN